jgi:hypothetical protein
MKPWVPVKMQIGKRQEPKDAKKRRKVSHDLWMEIDSTKIGGEELGGGYLEKKGIYVTPNEGYQLQWSSFGNLDAAEPLLPPLDFALDFAIQNASLHQSQYPTQWTHSLQYRCP